MPIERGKEFIEGVRLFFGLDTRRPNPPCIDLIVPKQQHRIQYRGVLPERQPEAPASIPVAEDFCNDLSSEEVRDAISKRPKDIIRRSAGEHRRKAVDLRREQHALRLQIQGLPSLILEDGFVRTGRGGCGKCDGCVRAEILFRPRAQVRLLDQKSDTDADNCCQGNCPAAFLHFFDITIVEMTGRRYLSILILPDFAATLLNS